MKPAAALALFLSLVAGALPAAGQTQYWMHQFGGPWDDQGAGVAHDGAAGVFVCGGTHGPGSYSDVWLARYGPTGDPLWTFEFGTSSVDLVRACAPDGVGGVFIAGETTGNLGAPNAGSFDAWITRYDSSGTRLWIQQFGTDQWDSAQALSPDGVGGAHVAGNISYIGPGVLMYIDAWLARYDSGGSRTWYRQFGSKEDENTWALASDGADGTFIGGSTSGSFGGPHVGSSDAWLARIDRAGNTIWVRQFGTPAFDSVRALEYDGGGGVYAAGIASGSLAGSHEGGIDAWVARYDGEGEQIWIKQFGTGGDDYAHALAPDGAGGLFAAGSASGSLGPLAAGGRDAWLARYDSRGTRSWIRQFGTSESDGAFALAPAGVGQVFAAGSTMGSLGGPNAGWFDAWVGRFGPCYPDCGNDGQLTVADFACFQTKFVLGDIYADCTGDGKLTPADFGCFQTAFAKGCP